MEIKVKSILLRYTALLSSSIWLTQSTVGGKNGKINFMAKAQKLHIMVFKVLNNRSMNRVAAIVKLIHQQPLTDQVWRWRVRACPRGTSSYIDLRSAMIDADFLLYSSTL